MNIILKKLLVYAHAWSRIYLNLKLTLKLDRINYFGLKNKIKIAFATHSIRSLKMIEAGVPKEKLGLMNAPFQIVQILTPILIGNIANTNRPLDLFVKIYPVR